MATLQIGSWNPLNKRFSTERIVQLAALSAVCFVGRIVFSGIPNVQPVTALLIIFTQQLGLRDSTIIMILTMLLSNMTLGLGPWTLLQIVSYFIVLLVTYYLIKMVTFASPQVQFVFNSIVCGFAGILFGFIISLLWTLLFQVNHFWAYYLRGVSFDLAHALGNIVFYLLLYPTMTSILRRFSSK